MFSKFHILQNIPTKHPCPSVLPLLSRQFRYVCPSIPVLACMSQPMSPPLCPACFGLTRQKQNIVRVFCILIC